jgi:cytochrome c
LGTTGFVWTEAEFVTYVADPKKFLVNKLDNKKARSKMSFKLKKDADARNIWAYLVSVSE